MNLFRIDFRPLRTADPSYPQVVHTIQDTATTRKIISLSLSSEKLVSISSYMREPRRCQFSIIADTWITSHILSGENEFERGISHYGITVKRDGITIFTGFIDTSVLSYDPSSSELSIIAYDALKLLQLYSDLEHLYSIISGYLPEWILQYYVNAISSRLGIQLSSSSQVSTPFIEDTDLQLYSIPFDGVVSPPPASSSYTYTVHASSWNQPKFGLRANTVTNEMLLLFAHFHVIVANNIVPQYAQSRAKARIVRIWNNICVDAIDFENRSDWTGYSQIDSLLENEQELIEFFTDNAIDASALDALSIIAWRGNALRYSATTDNTSHVSTCRLDVMNYPELGIKESLLPSRIQFENKHFGAAELDVFHTHLSALQAAMLINNATLTAPATGGIQLRKKTPSTALPATILPDDVTSVSLRRVQSEQPELSALDNLAGDTTLLKSYLNQFLTTWHARWELSLTIDDIASHPLNLSDTIIFNDKSYQIMEITHDYEKDSIIIRGWQL